MTAIEEDIEARIAALREAQETVPELAKKAEEELEARWKAEKFDIVPGEELLRNIFARYGLGYKKERDSIGLAGSLRKEEVHADLMRIIDEVCRA